MVGEEEKVVVELVEQSVHSSLKVKYSVRGRHSWLPRSRNSVVGYASFSAHRYSTHCARTHTRPVAQ